MSKGSSIEWCDSSWNPIRASKPLGKWFCQKISPGCDNCYASTFNRRLGGMMYPPESTASTSETLAGVEKGLVYLDEDALTLPMRWRKPQRIFVGSMTDIAGAWVPDTWLDAIWAVMALAPQHTYMVLTKRPSRLLRWVYTNPYQRVLDFANHHIRSERPKLTSIPIDDPAKFPYRHVWIGVSVESDAYVWRANVLRSIPAAVRWISAEPLLGPLPSLDLASIDWLVTGGESGHGHRPFNLDWARDLRDRAVANGTAYFHKQHGGRTPKAGGRDLDGRTWDQFPGSTPAVLPAAHEMQAAGAAPLPGLEL